MPGRDLYRLMPYMHVGRAARHHAQVGGEATRHVARC